MEITTPCASYAASQLRFIASHSEQTTDLDGAERLLAQGTDALPNAAAVIVAEVFLGHTAMACVTEARGNGPGAISSL